MQLTSLLYLLIFTFTAASRTLSRGSSDSDYPGSPGTDPLDGTSKPKLDREALAKALLPEKYDPRPKSLQQWQLAPDGKTTITGELVDAEGGQLTFRQVDDYYAFPTNTFIDSEIKRAITLLRERKETKGKPPDLKSVPERPTPSPHNVEDQGGEPRDPEISPSRKHGPSVVDDSSPIPKSKTSVTAMAVETGKRIKPNDARRTHYRPSGLDYERPSEPTQYIGDQPRETIEDSNDRISMNPSKRGFSDIRAWMKRSQKGDSASSREGHQNEEDGEYIWDLPTAESQASQRDTEAMKISKAKRLSHYLAHRKKQLKAAVNSPDKKNCKYLNGRKMVYVGGIITCIDPVRVGHGLAMVGNFVATKPEVLEPANSQSETVTGNGDPTSHVQGTQRPGPSSNPSDWSTESAGSEHLRPTALLPLPTFITSESAIRLLRPTERPTFTKAPSDELNRDKGNEHLHGTRHVDCSCHAAPTGVSDLRSTESLSGHGNADEISDTQSPTHRVARPLPSKEIIHPHPTPPELQPVTLDSGEAVSASHPAYPVATRATTTIAIDGFGNPGPVEVVPEATTSAESQETADSVTTSKGRDPKGNPDRNAGTSITDNDTGSERYSQPTTTADNEEEAPDSSSPPSRGSRWPANDERASFPHLTQALPANGKWKPETYYPAETGAYDHHCRECGSVGW